jgi:hypothetical protein
MAVPEFDKMFSDRRVKVLVFRSYHPWADVIDKKTQLRLPISPKERYELKREQLSGNRIYLAATFSNYKRGYYVYRIYMRVNEYSQWPSVVKVLTHECVHCGNRYRFYGPSANSASQLPTDDEEESYTRYRTAQTLNILLASRQFKQQTNLWWGKGNAKTFSNKLQGLIKYDLRLPQVSLLSP